MKICAVSDLHGSLEGLDFSGCDVVLFAGDVAPFRHYGMWQVYQQKKWVQDKFCKIAGAYPDAEFVVVPGNHDFFPLGKSRFGDKADWSVSWPKNMRMLVDEEASVKGMRIYGTPWVPIISHFWAFEAESDVLNEKFSKIPEGLDILVTHSPPRMPDSFADYSLFPYMRGPFGSSELAKAVYEKKPKYHVFGHIHTGMHGFREWEGVKTANVSRLDESYEIKYDPTFFEV